jgi:energy-coupling factor transporter ATP-binding protein EcfA2
MCCSIVTSQCPSSVLFHARQSILLPFQSTKFVVDVEYHPPGCDAPLLKDINLELPSKSLGLVYGRSGAGKTTLLQLIAGLRDPSRGLVSLVDPSGARCTRSRLTLSGIRIFLLSNTNVFLFYVVQAEERSLHVQLPRDRFEQKRC